MTARRLWDLFVADEPPGARRVWDRLARLADECNIDLFDLPARMGELPVTVHPLAVNLWMQLDALGALRRLVAWMALRDQIDAIDADALLIASPWPRIEDGSP